MALFVLDCSPFCGVCFFFQTEEQALQRALEMSLAESAPPSQPALRYLSSHTSAPVSLCVCCQLCAVLPLPSLSVVLLLSLLSSPSELFVLNRVSIVRKSVHFWECVISRGGFTPEIKVCVCVCVTNVYPFVSVFLPYLTVYDKYVLFLLQVKYVWKKIKFEFGLFVFEWAIIHFTAWSYRDRVCVCVCVLVRRSRRIWPWLRPSLPVRRSTGVSSRDNR